MPAICSCLIPAFEALGQVCTYCILKNGYANVVEGSRKIHNKNAASDNVAAVLVISVGLIGFINNMSLPPTPCPFIEQSSPNFL